MPITGSKHRQPLFQEKIDIAVQHRNNLIPSGHRKGPARAEIILHILNQQSRSFLHRCHLLSLSPAGNQCAGNLW
jgi:hypothetical protein